MSTALLTLIFLIVVTLSTAIPGIRDTTHPKSNDNIFKKISYHLRKYKKYIGITGGFFGAITGYLASIEQSEYQKSLSLKSDTIILLNKKLQLPIPNKAIIYFTIDFNINESNLKTFEKITIQELDRKIDEPVTYAHPDGWIKVPDNAIHGPNNPFLSFKDLVLFLEFQHKEKLTSICTIGRQFKIKFMDVPNAMQKANVKFSREDYYDEREEDNQDPLLWILYSRKFRKFRLECNGKLLPWKKIPTYVSLYDLENTLLNVYIIPTGDLGKLPKNSIFNLERLSIRSFGNFWFEINNFKRYNSDNTGFSYYYKHSISKEDLKLDHYM